jgi:hypothetical protein
LSPPPPERRRGSRVNLEATALIRVDSVGPALAARVFNASEGGLLLLMPTPRAVGTRIAITVQVANPPMEIQVHGIIVHVQAVEEPVPAVKAGIALTATTPQWVELCQRLADLEGKKIF